MVQGVTHLEETTVLWKKAYPHHSAASTGTGPTRTHLRRTSVKKKNGEVGHPEDCKKDLIPMGSPSKEGTSIEAGLGPRLIITRLRKMGMVKEMMTGEDGRHRD